MNEKENEKLLRTCQPVTIVPPEPRENGLTLAQGTKIFLADGSEVGNVQKLVLTAEPGGLWQAEVTLLPKAGIIKGAKVNFNQPRPSWWRTFLVRLAGCAVDNTSISSRAKEYRKP